MVLRRRHTPVGRALSVCALLIGLADGARAEALSSTVLAGLEADKPRLRIAAIVAVAKSDDENARRYVEGMLADKDASVRAAACEALMKRGDPAAIPAIEALVDDKSPLVQKVRKKALAALAKSTQAPAGAVSSGRRVLADLSDATDGSGKAAPGIVERLRANVAQALSTESKLAVDVKNEKQRDGFGLKLRVKSVEEQVQGAAIVVLVKCEMTLVKLPENALRLQSVATAGAGLEGDALTDRERADLQKDAVDACAPELAKDFVEYALTRAR